MRLRILLAGKVREKFLRQGLHEYLRRLRPYARVEVVEVGDEPLPERAAPADLERLREREAERLLKHGGTSVLVALDLCGQGLSSEEFAAWLSGQALHGASNIAFAIGSTTGLAPTVLGRARMVMSLGPMTFPHQLVPLLLLEQLYRAYRIQRNEPYHW